MSEFSVFEQVASRLKAPPEEIVIAVSGLIAQKDKLGPDAVQETLEPLGIGAPPGVDEEMSRQSVTFERDEMAIEDSLVQGCALVLASLAFTGRLDFDDARELVHEHMEGESLNHAFDAELYRYEADQASRSGNTKLALKLARKAINFATKSGSIYEIAFCRYEEGLILAESGDYRSATKKLSMLWKIYESDEAQDDPRINRDHPTKNALLTMWRDAHARIGELEQACKVQGMLYELGYKKETAEEWRALMGQRVLGRRGN